MSKEAVVVSVSEILFFVGPIVAQFCFYRYYIIEKFLRNMDDIGKVMIPIVLTLVGTCIIQVILTYHWIIKW